MYRLSVSAVPIRLFAVLPLSCVLTIGISRRSLFSSERPPMHRELDSPSPQTTAPTSAPLPSFVLSSTLSKATESHPEALVSLKSRFAITNDQHPITLPLNTGHDTHLPGLEYGMLPTGHIRSLPLLYQRSAVQQWAPSSPAHQQTSSSMQLARMPSRRCQANYPELPLTSWMYEPL